ncbi:MAG: glutamate-cysteine ligase family protein [Halobacteriota archaeon]
MSHPPNPPVRRSIEVEYWVIDQQGRLVEPGELVSAAPGVEREFVEPLLEIKTTPAESTETLRAELFSRIRAVLRRGAAVGKRLVPLATPLADQSIDPLGSDRIRIQQAVVGDDFEYVKHCAGTHIHVEQQPETEIDQLNTLIALDPALALANSTPYGRGRRLANGARSLAYRRLAYASIPYQGRLWAYASSREEWLNRREQRYEEFVDEATAAGFDRSTVESVFDPESAIWTPVQLRETFGTVEWRSPDATLPDQTVRLADTIARIVERLRSASVRIGGDRPHISEDEFVLPAYQDLQDYVDDAIHVGVGSANLRAYLARMGFDVDAFDPIAHEFTGEPSISPQEARRIRLEAADRLEAVIGGRDVGPSITASSSANRRSDQREPTGAHTERNSRDP